MSLVEDVPTAGMYLPPMLCQWLLFLRLLLTWKWYITGALQSAWQAMCFAQTTLYFTARAKETCSPDVTDGPRGSLSERPPALEQEWLSWMHWNKWVQVGNILENLFLLIWKAEIFFPKKAPWRPSLPADPRHVHLLLDVHSWSCCAFRGPGSVTTSAQTTALFSLARQTTNWLVVGHFLCGFPPRFNREENRWGEDGNLETWQRGVNFPPPGFFAAKISPWWFDAAIAFLVEERKEFGISGHEERG